ncbi:MAG: hypothetical protein P8J32_04775 [bacterium]|nr:hypothetical protein [bacterium]
MKTKKTKLGSGKIQLKWMSASDKAFHKCTTIRDPLPLFGKISGTKTHSMTAYGQAQTFIETVSFEKLLFLGICVYTKTISKENERVKLKGVFQPNSNPLYSFSS